MALLYLLSARFHLFATLRQVPQQIPESDQKKPKPTHYTTEPPTEKPHQCQADTLMPYWHMSNHHLEHSLDQLTEHVLEHHTIDLNNVIGNIIGTLTRNLDTTHHTSNEARTPITTKVTTEVGVATALPVVIAPQSLLHWIFSELIVSSWFNSLPIYNPALHEPTGTVVVSCLDADDSWHITVSSDDYHPSFVMASPAQLKTALRAFGGDLYTICDDDALVQTVVLPKYPHAHL